MRGWRRPRWRLPAPARGRPGRGRGSPRSVPSSAETGRRDRTSLALPLPRRGGRLAGKVAARASAASNGMSPSSFSSSRTKRVSGWPTASSARRPAAAARSDESDGEAQLGVGRPVCASGLADQLVIAGRDFQARAAPAAASSSSRWSSSTSSPSGSARTHSSTSWSRAARSPAATRECRACAPAARPPRSAASASLRADLRPGLDLQPASTGSAAISRPARRPGR